MDIPVGSIVEGEVKQWLVGGFWLVTHMSNESDPGCLGVHRYYTTQLCKGLFHKP